jgi:hypothetical protein
MICGAYNKEQLRGQMLAVDTDSPVVAKLKRLGGCKAKSLNCGNESSAARTFSFP